MPIVQSSSGLQCKRRVVLVAAALLLCLVSSARAAPVRHAIIIGTNQGLGAEPLLEFAQSDARRVATTLTELGVVSPGTLSLLLDEPLDSTRLALLNAPATEEMWVFISGHAGADGVHIKNAVWPWAELRRTLEALPAKRRIVFIDSCNSGAILTAKGISLESQLNLSVRANLEGLVMLVSSGANELSYESRSLRGSPFAHFLMSALRGAADGNGDGRVTLIEVYQHLYSRTVAASLTGAAGPQHPAQAGWYRGTGEWVLSTQHSGQGGLRLGDSRLGTCYVLDPGQTTVLAESRALDAGPVHLPPGTYPVRCVGPEGTQQASVTLGASTVALESLRYEPAPHRALLSRGGRNATTRLTLSGRAGIGIVNARTSWTGSAALGLTRGDLASELSISILAGRDLLGEAAILGRLPWWSSAVGQLKVGLSAGVLTAPREALHLTLGPLVELSFPLGQWEAFLRSSFLRSIPLDTTGTPDLPVFLSGGMRWSGN